MLNIKWAAYRHDRGITRDTTFSYNITEPGPAASGRPDTTIGEIGGPVALPGDEDGGDDFGLYEDDGRQPWNDEQGDRHVEGDVEFALTQEQLEDGSGEG